MILYSFKKATEIDMSFSAASLRRQRQRDFH
jgi:hypothetical protein